MKKKKSKSLLFFFFMDKFDVVWYTETNGDDIMDIYNFIKKKGD